MGGCATHLGVEFFNNALASEREHGLFAPSPGGGGPHWGPFLFWRGGDGDGIVLGLLRHEVVRCRSCGWVVFEASCALEKVIFSVLGSTGCVVCDLVVVERDANGKCENFSGDMSIAMPSDDSGSLGT